MESNRKPPHLLVVDDEKDIGEFIRFVASNAGYEVTSIIDSHEFIEVYNHDLAVIVLDLSMPGMDGIELIRFLASVNSRAELILMSGFDSGVLHSAKELANSRGLKVLGALEKPIAIKDFESLLSKASELPDDCEQPEKKCQPVSAGELRQAIQNGEITTYYQPKVDMTSYFLVALEALARWHHPEKGVINPECFIDLAEESGLIGDLTSLVLEKALADCSALKSKGIIVQVAVNISAKTLTDLDFPDQLQKKLIAHKLDPSQLIIEVVESAITDDISHALDILTRIRMKGIHLAIDDFGTGYSSMQMLHRGPFDELKIDRSFVCHMESDHDARTIIDTSINFSKNLKMKVVAEGVESQEIWNSLRKMRCDQAQGNYISPAIPINDIPHWLSNWTKKQFRLCCA